MVINMKRQAVILILLNLVLFIWHKTNINTVHCKFNHPLLCWKISFLMKAILKDFYIEMFYCCTADTNTGKSWATFMFKWILFKTTSFTLNIKRLSVISSKLIATVNLIRPGFPHQMFSCVQFRFEYDNKALWCKYTEK